MRNTKNPILIALKVINILIIIVIIWYIFFRNKEAVSDPNIIYEYKTDTIFLSEPYEVPKPYKVITPPRIITEYIIDSQAIKDLQISLSEKEILISNLLDTIVIHENYLKQFPNNPKLISMGLTKDSLNLATMKISGQVADKIWPINLNDFSYRWDYLSDLSRHPTKPPPAGKLYKTNSFVGGGVYMVNLSPYLSYSLERDYTRFRLYGKTQFILLDIKTSNILFGVDYKINGRTNNRNIKRIN